VIIEIRALYAKQVFLKELSTELVDVLLVIMMMVFKINVKFVYLNVRLVKMVMNV
jgi:hypothetical protein